MGGVKTFGEGGLYLGEGCVRIDGPDRVGVDGEGLDALLIPQVPQLHRGVASACQTHARERTADAFS